MSAMVLLGIVLLGVAIWAGSRALDRASLTTFPLHQGEPVITARLGDRTLKMLLDSGSPRGYVPEGVAAAPPGAKIESGRGRRLPETVLFFSDQPFITRSLHEASLAPDPKTGAEGVLGADFLDAFSVAFDSERHVVEIGPIRRSRRCMPSDRMEPNRRGRFASVVVDLNGSLVSLLIDTGSPAYVSLKPEIAQGLGLIAAAADNPAAIPSSARVRAMQLVRSEIRNVPVEIAPHDIPEDGVLGMKALLAWDAMLDLAAGEQGYLCLRRRQPLVSRTAG